MFTHNAPQTHQQARQEAEHVRMRVVAQPLQRLPIQERTVPGPQRMQRCAVHRKRASPPLLPRQRAGCCKRMWAKGRGGLGSHVGPLVGSLKLLVLLRAWR